MLVASPVYAQHLRVYAVALANDSAGSFMGASSNGSGLYQSDDSGRTWKHLGWQNVKSYSMDIVQSTNGRILYMACGNGVLRSTDFGEHWKVLTDWRITEVMDVAIDQLHPNNIYIATAQGPWSSDDSGQTWRPITMGMHSLYCTRVYTNIDPENRLILLGEDGVFTLQGDSWQLLPNSPKNATSLSVSNKSWRVSSLSETGVRKTENRNFSIDKELPPRSFFITNDNSNILFGGARGYRLVKHGASSENTTIKNASTAVFLGDDALIGTLGDGVYGPHGHSLLKLQIWTLKSYLVRP